MTDRDPQSWQEAHSPTEPVELVVSHTPRRVTQICVRRVADSRLWENLSHGQQRAAERIYQGFRFITEGLRHKPQSFERYDKSRPGDAPVHLFDISRQYFEWAKECKREKISHAAIVSVLCFGQSCRQTDRQRRKKKGWSRRQLWQGLELYCKVAGIT